MLAMLILLPASKKYRAIRVCLVFLTAGAAGNLYDRIFFDYVTDFLYFSYINFPIFNVADIYVTLSTITLVILFLFFYSEDDLDLKKINKIRIHSSMLDEEETEDDEDVEEEEEEEETEEDGE